MSNLKQVTIVDILDGYTVLCAERLRAARNSLPQELQSLTKIHEITGISIPQLSNYFAGKDIPHLKNFKKLCLYLQVPADYLLGLRVERVDIDSK